MLQDILFTFMTYVSNCSIESNLKKKTLISINDILIKHKINTLPTF